MADTTCSVDGCTNPIMKWNWKKAGLCEQHAAPVCVVADCPRKVVSNIEGQGRVCGLHRRRWLDYGSWDLPTRGRKICKVDGCERFSERRTGMCAMHHNWNEKWGSTEPPKRALYTGKTGVAWLAALPLDVTECIFWPGTRNAKGYGTIKDSATGEKTAHRIVCRIFHGPPPEGRPHALHACGQGMQGCVNPSHLYWGNPPLNSADMVAHGNSQRGSRAYNAKVTESDINPIRYDGRPVEVIAEDYGVSKWTIYDIKRGRNWWHVPWVDPRSKAA